MRFTSAAVVALFLSACSTPMAPAGSAPTCSTEDLRSSVGVTEGAAGTSYTTLVLTNTGAHSCTLEGTPRAQPVLGSDRTPVAGQSGENPLDGAGASIELAPGTGTAHLLYGVAEASNYPSNDCEAAESDGVVVTFADGPAVFYFPLRSYQTCTKTTSTFISGVLPGSE